MKTVKKLTVSAIVASLCIIFLYLGSVIHSVQISFIAIAALFPAVAVMHCGYFWAVAVYLISGGLALLLLPDKIGAIWFLLVFGHYGIVKSLIERVNKPIIEWILKIITFSICIAAEYLLFRAAFISYLPPYSEMILFVGLLVCLVLYDIAFSALISFYNRRIYPHVH